MSDDLTAQVREAVESRAEEFNMERVGGIGSRYWSEADIAAFVAPRIAACMQAVEDAAWVRGQRGDVTAFGEERTWAAGLQALRGET